jgi:hypothetical protein
MQKTVKISCCAECSVYLLKSGRIPHCGKLDRRIDEKSDNSINPALIGFPEWCPLETVEPEETITDYKREVKHIMKIMTDDSNPDALQEASHYLNSVVENAKKKVEETG